MASLAAERARRLAMERSLGADVEARQAATEAAQRQTTGAGTLFDLDPMTGRLAPASQGVKGATPEIFMSDTGRALNDAAAKVASRQTFALTAAEKVAWEKTKVDLAAAAPEFGKLTPSQIADKMMDRQWVADAVQKIRDKAQAFDEIAKRATSAQAMRDAVASRERMTDLLTTLEDTLRAPRPAGGSGQGPKTREFNRNQLLTNTENNNALAPRITIGGIGRDKTKK